MSKNKNKNNNIKLILLLFGIPFGIILIPFTISILLLSVFSQADGYLVTGLCFYLFISILIIGIIVMFIMKIYKKGQRVNSLCDLYKRFPIIFIIFIIIIVVVEGLLFKNEICYIKDIADGPQKLLLKDVIVKKEYTYKGNYSYYVEAYINNKKTRLYFINDYSFSDDSQTMEIYYYKNIKEIIKISYMY